MRLVTALLGQLGFVPRAEMDAALASLQANYTATEVELQKQIAALQANGRRTAEPRSVCAVCPKHAALVARTENAAGRIDKAVGNLESLIKETWPDGYSVEAEERAAAMA